MDTLPLLSIGLRWLYVRNHRNNIGQLISATLLHCYYQDGKLKPNPLRNQALEMTSYTMQLHSQYAFGCNPPAS